MTNPAVVWHEIVGWVLRCHTALQCEPGYRNLVLRTAVDAFVAKRNTLRHKNLTLHDINTGDLFSHGVFNLNPRVHFNEVKLTGVRINEELNGSRCLITNRRTNLHGCIKNTITHLHIQIRRGCDLYDFLMTPLNTAIAFIQMHQVAVMVTQQLHLNMLRAADELFDEDVGATERRQ